MISLHVTAVKQKGPDPAGKSEETRLLITDADGLLAPLPIERIERFSFNLNDVPFSVRREKASGDDRVRMTAILGYLPFTAESAEKRKALLDILSATRSLSRAHFGLDPQSRIVVTGLCPADTQAASDFLFYPLILFLQEAKPFIELIGRHL